MYQLLDQAAVLKGGRDFGSKRFIDDAAGLRGAF
jgi:hypothetical protein